MVSLPALRKFSNLVEKILQNDPTQNSAMAARFLFDRAVLFDRNSSRK